MNGLSISQLCCLFCCPPCPSRIAAKLAFLPPEPTYAMVSEPEPVGSTGSLRGAAGRWKLHLKDRADFQYSQRELDNIEVFVTKSSRGNRVGCMYVRCVPGARQTSRDIRLCHVRTPLPCGITSWPLCPSVFACQLWGCATGPLSSFTSPGWDELFLCLSLAARPVGPRGQSLSWKLSHGDVVTAICSLSVTPGQIFSLAETLCPSLSLCSAMIKERFLVPLPGDVLGAGGMGTSHSPCLPPLSPLFPIHPLGSIEKISKITSPVLIIHGTEDEVIDFSHGLALFERCPKAVEPLWVDGAGHNDIELYSQYLERLRKFISQELASQRN
ncbi:AB17A protein, partial [Ptilorrhoa leucosticta]|nr:AB17A protein [Ptilorrhoa leucosticta]